MTSTTSPRSTSRARVAAPERVVFAVDDSHGAVAAAGWLADRAAHHPIAIELVVVEGAVRSGQHEGAPDVIAEGVAWRMREYLAARIPTAGTTVRVLRGDVVDGLKDAAHDGDLLVLGCNRSRFWQHFPLATRSTRVAEEAVRPTVLVPASWLPATGPVVAAVAASGGDAAIDWAADEASARDRELLLVRGNILPWSLDMPAVPVPDIVLLDDADRLVLARAAARARAAHPGLDVRTELDHDGVVRELVSHGAHAAVLVLGAEAGPPLGSVLRGVLEQAPCPVVVVPDGVRS